MMIYMTRMSYGKSAADLRDADLHSCMTRGHELFDVLTGATKSDSYSKNSPVKGMWRGYEYALGIYVMMSGMEWCYRRGFAGHKSFWPVFKGIQELKHYDKDFVYEVPPWFRDTDVLASHRSNLVRRDPLTYEDTWHVCPQNWPYLWPIIDKKFPDGYRLMLSAADKTRLQTGERVLPKAQKARVVNWP